MNSCHPLGVYPASGTHPRQCNTCGSWYDLPCDCAERVDAEERERGLWIDQTLRDAKDGTLAERIANQRPIGDIVADWMKTQ